MHKNTLSIARFLPAFARFTLLAAVLLITAACANGPRFQQLPASTTEANIYVYRPQWPVAATTDVEIFVNDQDLGVLHSGGYLATHVKPGMVTVTGKTVNHQQVNINAEAGKNYYVRVDTVTDAETVVGPWIQEVPERKGFVEINDLKLSL
jgi:hypothetical protein